MLVFCSLVRKAYYLLCSRHPFFKEAELGARIAAEGCKFHFLNNSFSFVSLFWAVFFQLAKVADS